MIDGCVWVWVFELVELREIREHLVLGIDIEHVVEPPVDLSDTFSGMEESLENVLENDAWAKTDPQSFNGLVDGVDDVGTGLEDIWPREVKQVDESVFGPQALHA